MSSTSKGGSGLGTSTKMCKSPKNSSGIYQKPDSTSSTTINQPSYETLNTNCTVVGSNNLHLLKKHQQVQQQVQIQVQSPIYSNASPVGGMVFPPPTSPYTGGGGGGMSPAPAHKASASPGLASGGIKSPQSAQVLQQTVTPQQNYSVMQIIHNPLIGRSIPAPQQSPQQNIIKLKPHLNILPKPANIQQVPRSSVSPHQQLLTIPTVTPTTVSIPHTNAHAHTHQLISHAPTQQPIIINQMPTHAMLTAAGQLQFILRPTTHAQQQQMQHVPVSISSGATNCIQTKQSLGQLNQQQVNSLIQLQQLQQQQQQQQLATLQLPPPPPPPALVGGGAMIGRSIGAGQTQQVIQQVQLQAAGGGQQAGQQLMRVMTNGLASGGVMQGIVQQGQTGTTYVATQNHIHAPVNISPKKKPKKKKQKLDLANIMKLSGIGDDDDVQFESDASQSEGEPNSHSQSVTPQPQISLVQSSQSQPTVVNTATSAAAAAAAVQAAAVQAAAFQQQHLVQNQLLQPTTLATLLQSLQHQQVHAQQMQAAQKQQLGNMQMPTVQTATPSIVQVLSNQSFTTTPSGLVTPTNCPNATPHILSIPTSSHLTAHQPASNVTTSSIHQIPAAAFAPFNLSTGAAGATSVSNAGNGVTTSATAAQNFALNGATRATATGHHGLVGTAGTTAGATSANTLPVAGLGGFKLALGEDGRLVLQHDPGLHQQQQQVQQQQQQQQQDLQSQLLLQTIFGLSGGGLLLQPTTIDQQVHSQTVQTIQQQSVQTIQQQTVQSQTVQHHSLQTIQQTIQPQIQAQTVQQTIHHHHHHQVQQPVAPTPVQPQQTGQTATTTMQLVQPQTIQQLIQQQQLQQQQSQPQVVNSISVSPAPAQSPIQLPQLQQQQHQHQVVNSIAPLPQAINSVSGHGHNHHHHHHHHHHQPVLKVQPIQKSQPPIPTPQPVVQQQPPSTPYVVNLTPDQLEQLKRNGQLTVNGQTIFMQRAPPVNTTSSAATTNTTHNNTTSSANIDSTALSNIGGGGDKHLIGVSGHMGVGIGQQQHVLAGQIKASAPKAIKRKGVGNKILGNKDVTTSNSGAVQIHSVVTSHVQQAAPLMVPNNKGVITTGSSNIDKVINTVVREAAKSAGLMMSGGGATDGGGNVQKIVPQLSSTTKQAPNKKPTPTHQVRPIIPAIKQNATKQILPNIPSQIKPTTNVTTTTNRSLPNLTNQSKDNQEVVDRLLGQIIEESQQQKTSTPSAKSVTTSHQQNNTITAATKQQTLINPNGPFSTNKSAASHQPGQRVHTIQLTPQQQQYLKSVQLQIQTLSARLPQPNGDLEVQNALKVLFHEQQKILASGKLLPPDKVFYHNNQIIVNTGSTSGPTVLSTSGMTVLQPPSGKGLEVPGIGITGQQQQQQTVSKTDVGTSTNNCGSASGNGNLPIGNLLQPQTSSAGPTIAHHHPVNNNITMKTSHNQPATVLLHQINRNIADPSSSANVPKLPSLPSLHPLQQQQQQAVAPVLSTTSNLNTPLVVQLNSATQQSTTALPLQLDSVVSSNITKVPRPILPRLTQQQVKQQQQQQQMSVLGNGESATIVLPTQIQIGSNNQQMPSGVLLHQMPQQQQQSKSLSAIGVVGQVQQLIDVKPTVHQQPVQQLTGYMKSQRIEQQLSLDQSGAVNPDIQTPFRDKSDACKRLLRYHCYDQPVLSEKDLTKADEIFELTARHFIDKFGRMVDKYRYLLLKEGQRHVQTSELMMLDRMFLAEEQQSLIKLRRDIDEGNIDTLLDTNQQDNSLVDGNNTVVISEQLPKQELVDDVDSVVDNSNNEYQSDDDLEEIDDEEYDEWQCIQRELGCLASAATPPTSSTNNNPSTSSNTKLLTTNTNSNSSNCSNSSSTSSSSCFSSSSSFGKRLSNNADNLDSMKRYKVTINAKKHEENATQATHYSAQYSNATAYNNSAANNAEEMDNSGSIDEQVQSAIDSILNLQQTSGIARAHCKNDAADRVEIS